MDVARRGVVKRGKREESSLGCDILVLKVPSADPSVDGNSVAK